MGLALDSTGRAHVFGWARHDDGGVAFGDILLAHFNGTTAGDFSIEQVSVALQRNLYRLAVTPDGRLRAVWDSSFSFLYGERVADGGFEQSVVQDGGRVPFLGFDLAASTDGGVHVAYNNNNASPRDGGFNNDNVITYGQRFGDQWSLTELHRFTTAGNAPVGERVLIGIDPAGEPIVAYPTALPDAGMVAMVATRSGSTWSQESTGVTTTGVTHLSLAVNPVTAGDYRVAVVQQRSPSGGYVVSRKTNGGTWETVDVLGNGMSFTETYPVVRFGPDGTLFLYSRSNTGVFGLVIRRLLPAGISSQLLIRPHAGSTQVMNNQGNTGIVIGPDGAHHVVWRDARWWYSIVR